MVYKFQHPFITAFNQDHRQIKKTLAYDSHLKSAILKKRAKTLKKTP